MKVGVGIIGPRRGRNGYGLGEFVAREVLNTPSAHLRALLGTTEETLKQAIVNINSRRDVCHRFDGAAYPVNKKGEFFARQDMDLVIICSPSETHEEYIREALSHGIHVLVEKPLLYNPRASGEERMETAQSLLRLAADRGLLLSTNCQRAVIVEELSNALDLTTRPSCVTMDATISSKSKDLIAAGELLALMIAHPLSVLVKYGVLDHEAVTIERYHSEMHASVSRVAIEGTYHSAARRLRYDIALSQTRSVGFASLTLRVDMGAPVRISTEMRPDNTLCTKYEVVETKEAPGARVFFTEDHLKTCCARMIQAIYEKKSGNGQETVPIITNEESLRIYALQERFEGMIFED